MGPSKVIAVHSDQETNRKVVTWSFCKTGVLWWCPGTAMDFTCICACFGQQYAPNFGSSQTRRTTAISFLL
jgi:hypothetical protein